MTDITERKDIEQLIRKFYERVNSDELLASKFSHVDWGHHLPVMFSFWSSAMLGEQTYRGNPFQKHINLPLSVEHFKRWLTLFGMTVDESFSGPKAEEMKARAQNIALIFQHRMGLLDN